MPVVNPGIRRFLGSAIQRLFNSASFAAPLTHSAIPTRAASGTTATFTRATTKTWPNNDGYLVTGVSGEIGFVGARRVDNLIRLGAAQSSTLAVAANVTMTLPAGAYQFSMGAGTGRVTFSGTGGATGTLDAVTTGRVHVAKTITAGTLIVTASVATLVDIQVVSMVAETDQTTIREYVSVGVASSPYYHGSMVDGVKCFPTDLSGNPIPSTTLLGYQAEGARTNLCLQSNAFTTTWAAVGTPAATQNVTGPDGVANSAWTLTDNDAGVIEGIYQDITLTAATYTASYFIKKTTGAQASYPIIAHYPAAATTSMAAVTVDTTNGTATPFTAYTGFTGVSCTATCVSFNDSFWRVSVTFTGTAVPWRHNIIAAGTTDPTQSTGAATSSVTGSAVFYGAQVELGSFASSYIATTTIAVARNADVLTYTGGDIPNLKTLLCDFERASGVSGTGIMASLNDGTANNVSSIRIFDTTARFLGLVGGATQWSVEPAYTAGTRSKMAQSWATNDVKMAKDGAAQTQDTTATMPTVTQLNVGHQVGSFQLNGNVGPIYGWTRNQSQSELNAVTA